MTCEKKRPQWCACVGKKCPHWDCCVAGTKHTYHPPLTTSG